MRGNSTNHNGLTASCNTALINVTPPKPAQTLVMI